MKFTRRKLIESALRKIPASILGVHLLPRYALTSTNGTNVVTVSFSGTACTRDEGEKTREGSDKAIYLTQAGYIPVRINQELGGKTQHSGSASIGQVVRGVGENDWAVPRNNSEALKVDGPLNASATLRADISGYTAGNQLSVAEQISGFSMPALALHGANLAAASDAQTYNFIGHSRGACESIMAAWFLYAYGNEASRNVPVNILAIDPVPGPGDWYGILTQLPPNVKNFIGIYAWDHLEGLHGYSHFFQALVPRPNGRMRGEGNDITIHDPDWWETISGAHDWKILANDVQQRDPLAPGDHAQPVGYKLYACRGMHSTVSGNSTADGKYDPSSVSESTAPVPALIYKMARGYLTQWGASFTTPCAVTESVLELRRKIHRFHRDFDKMGGGETRNSSLPDRPLVRRISSIYGINPLNTYYMDNVVGDPPYKLAFPVTKNRKDAGWVNWNFL